MNDSYFTVNQQIHLAVIILFLVFSVFSFEFLKTKKTALFLLLFSAFTIKLFMILLSPYLFTWDEVFHGLVAKNLIKHPLTPTLYDKTLFPLGLSWSGTTIWLHKQPWFLWQMAISIKLFGTNAFAVRLPGLLYTVFATYCIYDIGKKTINESIGFYGSLFFITNYYLNDQISGRICLDQNDTIFLALIIFGFWALIRFLFTNKKQYIFLIGLFCGLAILTKWLVALIIFLCWGVYIILENKKTFYNIKHYASLVKALFVTVCVALPWQIYTHIAFPEHAKYEDNLNSKHITEAVEGHGGDNWFYYNELSNQYGDLLVPICIMGVFMLYTYFKNKNLYNALLISTCFIFCFFTFAATKMTAFTMVISFFLFLSLGAVTDKLSDFIKLNKAPKKLLFCTIILSVLIASLDIDKIQANFTKWKLVENNLFYMESELQSKQMADYIHDTEKDTSYVVFNAGFPGNIATMFFSNQIAYTNLPSDEDIRVVKNNKYKIGIIDNGNLPISIDTNKNFKIYRTSNLEIIRKDTFYLSSLSKGSLSDEVNKLSHTNTNTKTEFIFYFYKDGSCRIKAKNNNFTHISYPFGGLILLNGNEFNSTSQFHIEFISGNKFRVKAFNGKYFKIINEGERVVLEKLIENDNDFVFCLNKI